MARRNTGPFLVASLAWLLTGAGPDPATALAPVWDGMPGRAGWQMLVSPAFPREWPQPAGGTVVRYAFAMRPKPAVADGAEMAAPWARLTQDADGTVAVERLSQDLHPLGVQGVRPLRAAEIAMLDRDQDVADRLRAGPVRDDDGLVRAFTCGWTGRLGVVAASIAPRHPAFMRWLACP